MEEKLNSASSQKNTFKSIFLILVLMLMVLPFLTTFNNVLTNFVMSIDLYKLIQKEVVPWEIRMVGAILFLLGFKPAVMGEYLSISGQSNPFLIEIAWNCIGWQSLLFFVLTGWIGLQGNRYTFSSKLKSFVIGFIGTFLVNLLRIVLVVLVAYFFGQKIAIFFHDYGSTLAVLVWLFFFWWFSYKYVLETRGGELNH